MEGINYKKIVKDLNKELKLKYNSKELLNDFLEFELEDCQNYFTIEIDDYDSELIIFLNMIMYNRMAHVTEGHDSGKVIEITKTWFNKYIDSLYKLKF